MTPRERVFRALEFDGPDRVPRSLGVLPWAEMFAADELEAFYRDFPVDFIAPHGGLAPSERRRGREARRGTYVDDWGVAWEVFEDGIVGEVKEPLLADWAALDSYNPPWEIIKKADWDQVNRCQENNLAGQNKFMLYWPDVRIFERKLFIPVPLDSNPQAYAVHFYDKSWSPGLKGY